MRLLTATVVLGLAVTAFAQEKDKEPRVKAKEPTVVTVYGKKDNVDAQKAPDQPRSMGGKVLHGLGSGVRAAGRGVAGFTGWLLNTDDDIPRERDRDRTDQNSARQK